MSFSRELKDFVQNYTEERKLGMQRDLHQSQQEYYKARAKYYDSRATGKTDDANAAFTGGYNNAGGTDGAAPAASGAGAPVPPPDIKKIIDANTPPELRDYAYRMAAKESSFNPKDVSPTGATGLFQFTGGTGKQYGLVGQNGDLRTDPELNTKAFVKLTGDNYNTLKKALGRDPTWGELAIAHQQGSGGAIALLTGKGEVDPNNLKVNNARDANDIFKYYGYEPTTPGNYNANRAVIGGQQQALPIDAGNDDDVPVQGAAKGGMIRPAAHFAQGGAFDEAELPQEDMYDDADEGDAGGAPQQAIPTAPTPAGNAPAQGAPKQAAPAEGGKDNTLLGMALHGGLMFLQKAFGINEAQAGEQPQQQGAIPTGQQPRRDLGREFLMKGYGPMDEKSYNELTKAVGADKLDDSIRTIAGMEATYDHYLKHGEINKANSMAAALIQYSNKTAATFGDMAKAAIQSGNYPAAVELLKKGYNQVPVDATVDAKANADGSGSIVQRDGNGNVIMQGMFTPQQLMGAAQGLSDGSLFFNEVTQAAHKYLGNTGQPSQAYQEAMTRLYGGNQPGAPQAVPSQGATPAGNAPTQPGESQAVPTTGPAPAQAAPAGQPQGEKPQANPWDVPTREVYAGGDDEGVPSMPAEPKAPQYVSVDPKAMSQMSPKEQTSYRETIAAQNQEILREYNAQKDAYGRDAGTVKEARKNAIPKPYDFHPDQADALESGIESATSANILKVTNPATGKPFKSAEEANNAIGTSNVESINNIAKDIASFNPSLRTGKSSATMALALTSPGSDPKDMNFRPVGYAVGKRHVVLEAKNGQQIVVPVSTYKQIQKVHTDWGKKFGSLKQTADEEAKKPGVMGYLGKAARDTGSAIYQSMPTPNPASAIPNTAPPVIPQRPTPYSPNSSTVDARDLLGTQFGTGAR
jgi:hypothetical protein